ncbi:unnamed protein product [Closterium sp. Yama58-4]|nr:unnamed protein product [Closterium sp. Yama58-4]
MSTSLIRSARCTAAEILSISSQIIHALSSLLLLFRALVALAACRLALTFLLPPLRAVQRIVRFVCLVETWLSAIVRDIEFYGKARDLEHREEYTENAAYAWSCEGVEQVGCDEWSPWDQLRLSSSSLGDKSSPGRLWDEDNMRRWVEEARAVAKLATAAGEEDLVTRRGGEGRSRTIAAGTSGELHVQENDALRHELQQARATCDALRQELEQEWVLSDSLRRELEQERAAADSAAMASMESIRRLQDDKAADQLAARQRERILVEKARYEEEEVEGLRAEVERQGEEILLLREQMAAVAGFRYVTSETNHDCAETEGDGGDSGGREDESSVRGEEEEGSERGARIHNIEEDQGSHRDGGAGGPRWLQQCLKLRRRWRGDAASLSYALGGLLRPFLPAAKAADAGLLAPVLRPPLREPAAAGMASGSGAADAAAGASCAGWADGDALQTGSCEREDEVEGGVLESSAVVEE